MQYIDSHFHLSSLAEKQIDTSLPSIEKGIDIGTECDDWPKRKELLHSHPNFSYSLGIGPWALERKESIDEMLAILRQNISQSYPVAIGEIGLDAYWHYGTKELQRELFTRQILLAEELGLPIIIHCREADTEMLSILKEQHFSKKGILHCFQGDEELLAWAEEEGFYISFAGCLTYKANEHMREALKKVERHHLLMETDAPYLSPVPMRGKPNTPENIGYTYALGSTLLEMGIDEYSTLIRNNFNAFLSQ